MTKLRSLVVCTFAVLLIALSATAGVEDKRAAGHWVSAWSTAVHTPLPFPGVPPTPVLENQTVRMVVRPTIGGERVRIRFSNAFGATALSIGARMLLLPSRAPASCRNPIMF